EDDGRLFIAMELLDGKDLRRLVVDGDHLSLEDKLSIMSQVCDGLHHAHGQAVIPRDVKLSKVVLLRSGTVKILGVAQMVHTERTGLIVSTSRYPAPEQLRGQGDHRSNIFAAGAVFYELVSGRAPFTAPDPLQVLEQLRTQQPPSLDQLDPSVPTAL